MASEKILNRKKETVQENKEEKKDETFIDRIKAIFKKQ